MENPQQKASTRAKNKYNAANYEQIPVRVKKGGAGQIEAAAAKAGMSRNAYIMEAVIERMKQDGIEYEEKEQEG